MKTPFRMISGDRKMSHSRTQGRPAPGKYAGGGPGRGAGGVAWTSSGDVQQVGQLVVDVGVVIVAVEQLAACALCEYSYGEACVCI